MSNKQKAIKRGIGVFTVATLIGYVVNKEWAWILGLYIATGIFLCLDLITSGEIKKHTNPYIAHGKTFLLGPPKGLISWFL